jgi:exosome complex exonuclease DIS3/RRP44
MDNGPTGRESSNAPSLYKRLSFFRQTRKRGKVLKTVTERYIRDDLGLGSYYVDDDRSKRRVKEAVVGKPRAIEDTAQLLALLHEDSPLAVCDTNVLLHNLDVLEQSTEVIPNLVIPQTALVECRSNQLTAYDRTVELLRAASKQRLVIFFADPHHSETAHVVAEESGNAIINDVNDQRIRNVAAFYANQLQGTNVRVVLLTDDAGSRAKVDNDSGYEALSVRQYVNQLEKKNPGLALSDLVAQFDSQRAMGDADSPNELHFAHHVDAVQLSNGVKSGQYHQGVIRSTGPDTSLVTIRRGEERVAVTIQGWKDRNRAIDGDVVAISLKPLAQWMPTAQKTDSAEPKSAQTGIASETAEPSERDLDNVPDELSVEQAARSLRPIGFVVGIIRRNFATYPGSIYAKPSSADHSSEREEIAAKNEVEHVDGSETCVFFPVDKKIPPILIRTMQRDRLVGQRIMVSMDSWPAHSRYPLGHYVRSMGEAGTKDVETQVLLQQHKIPHEPFPAKVLACLPPEDYRIDAENSPGRTDLRHLPVLSIDPPGCKDIDDALHCIVLSNGNYQIGVHIADVCHYVKAGTAIDLEAANRSTSTYLVNKRLDMLPSLLTTDLCSLKCEVDR